MTNYMIDHHNPTLGKLMIASVWDDDDIQELEVRFNFDNWQGCSRAYAGWNGFRELADSLEEWLTNRDSTFRFELGTEDQPETGFIQLSAYSCDKWQHLVIRLRAISKVQPKFVGQKLMRMVDIEFPTETALLDRFITELRSIDRLQHRVGNKATLQLYSGKL